MTAQYAIAGCWTIWLLYWAVSAWFVKPTREVRWRAGGLRWLIAAVILASVLARALGWSLPTGEPLLAPARRPESIAIVGVALVIVGLAVALCARYTLAGNWSASVVLKEDHELITR